MDFGCFGCSGQSLLTGEGDGSSSLIEARVNAPNPALPTRPMALKPKWIVAGCLLLIAYVLMRPWLVERFGLDLPGFTDLKPQVEAPASAPSKAAQQKQDKHRPIEVPVIPEQSEPIVPEVSVAQSETPVVRPNGHSPRPENGGTDPRSTTTNPPKNSQLPGATSGNTPPRTTSSKAGPTKPATKPPLVKPTPSVASKPATPPTTPPSKPAQTQPTRPANTTPPAEPDKPKLGVLTPAGRGRFESTAGLIYSQYRIDHVMEHSRDIPDKPTHGVFEGTKDDIFALIDEAYELAQKRGPPQVVIEDEGDRTTYTVNLNRKVGHGGGQSGARRRNPPLKFLKIVLEGDEVITAFPTDR